LTGRGVVENVTDQRGLCGLGDEVLEALGRAAQSRCGATGITLVAPSDRNTPVPANDSSIMPLARSHMGWSMAWCAAVILHDAVKS
jgi:hypothetical protein